MKDKIKIAIVDDHKLVTDGFVKWFENHPRIEVLFACNKASEIIHFLNGHKLDLILTDLNMPGTNGIELVQKIRTSYPNQKIAILTMYYNVTLIKELDTLKVNGFIHKNYGLEELTTAILEIESSGYYRTKQVSRMMIQYDFSYSENDEIKDSFIKKFYLSKRELEIFELIIRNKSSVEISETLFIAEGTVSSHRKNIMRKTNCSSALALMHLAIEQGIYKID